MFNGRLARVCAPALAAVLGLPAIAAAGPMVNLTFSEGAGDTVTDAVNPSVVGTLAPIGGGRFTGAGGGFDGGGALYFDAPTTKAWSGHTTFAQFTSDFDLPTTGSLSFFVEHDAVGFRQAYFNGSGGTFRGEMHSSNRVFTEINGLDNFAGSTTTQAADDNWVHVVVTWDAGAGVSGENIVYLDGVQQGTANTTGATLLDEVVRFGRRIAVTPTDNIRPLIGGIDDIAFYSTVLTGGEIATIGASGAAAVAANQVAHWDLNDAPGTLTASDNADGLALHVGTPQGSGVTFDPGNGPTAAVPNALYFDGANELSRVIIKDTAALDFDKTAGTAMVWVKLDADGQRHTLFKTTDESIELQLTSSGDLFAAANDDDNTTGNNASGNAFSGQTIAVADGWTHVAFVWDQNGGTGGTMGFYIDGVFYPGTGGDGEWTVPDTADWVLGNDPIVPDRNLMGWLADFALFDRVLTDAEIQQAIDGGAASVTGVPAPAALPVGLALMGLTLMRRRR